MAEKIMMIALSPTMEQGMIVRWHKKLGETIASGDILCEVETDKATMEYESMVEGTLLHIIVPEKGNAAIGDPIAVIGEKGEDIAEVLAKISKKESASIADEGKTPVAANAVPISTPLPTQSAQPLTVAADTASTADNDNRRKASPLARKMAGEMGIDLLRITGSGPQGRIVKRDIEKAAVMHQSTPPPVAIPTALISHSLPVSQKRRIIARRLSESKYSAPHYYLQVTIDMERILQTRSNINARMDSKVSLNAFFIKLAAATLQKYPLVNSCWRGDTIEQFAGIDIGLAVAQPDGLVVPVVRDCAGKGIGRINEELHGLVERAQSGKLQLEEMQNATFTISNLGAFGIEEFTAIINPPGSAILALGQIAKQPVVGENDQVVIRRRMKATLSCDHRIIDGAVGAAFLHDWQSMVEDPLLALY